MPARAFQRPAKRTCTRAFPHRLPTRRLLNRPEISLVVVRLGVRDGDRELEPSEIAGVVAYLLSGDSAPTSGAAIPVYGRA